VPMLGVPEALVLLRSHGVKIALTTGFGRDVPNRSWTRWAGMARCSTPWSPWTKSPPEDPHPS
jgi:hypothetical protein